MSYVEKSILLPITIDKAWAVLGDLQAFGSCLPFVRSVERKKDDTLVWHLASPADVYLRTDVLVPSTILQESGSQHSWQAKGHSFNLVGVFFLEDQPEKGGTELTARWVVRSDGMLSRFLGVAFSMNMEEYVDGFFEKIRRLF